MRRLSAHERALWSRVAASVKPLPGKVAPAPAPLAAAPSPAPATPPPAATARPQTSTGRPQSTPRTAPLLGATLDGRWDRQISRGRLLPDRVIDLHGHNLADAHGQISAALHAGDGARVILVITGKGRPDRPSRIRAELMHWLERPDLKAFVASVRAAHPRHGGAGAFYIILRRAK